MESNSNSSTILIEEFSHYIKWAQQDPDLRPSDHESKVRLVPKPLIEDLILEPPGYETSSCRASLRRQFRPLEGALSSPVRMGLARSGTESKWEVTSRVASRQG
jgi:hypothetical protein